MTGNQRPLSLKARLGIAALTLTILVSAAGGGLVAIQPAKGIGIVEALVGRAIVRTISHKAEEKADRKAINQRRDAEKAEVNQQQQVLDFERGRDWLDQAAYQQESARLVALKKGIDERATRERQIVSFQTRNNIRNDLAGTVRDVLTVSTGMNPKAIDFAGSLLRGEKPITAAINATLAGGPQVVDPRQQFRELQQTLSEVEGGLRFVRDHRGILARAELARLLREMGGPDVTPEEAEEALNRARKLGEDVEKAVAQAGAIKKDLLPQSPGIDRQRFANNERWIKLNDNAQALKASKAGEAVLAGLLRAVGERAEALLAESGVTLTDEQLLAIAKEIEAAYAEARVKEGKVLDASVVNIDEIVRRVVNQQLALAGLEPLETESPTPASQEPPSPEPGETPSPEPEETPSPEAGETPSPEPEETPSPEPKETPSPEPKETPSPEPEETPSPEPQETPSPQPTEAPTPEGQKVTATGQFTNLSGYGELTANNMSLTFSSSGGAVSGQGHAELIVSGGSCKRADGTWVDDPTRMWKWDIAVLSGTYSADTGELGGAAEITFRQEGSCLFSPVSWSEDWSATMQGGKLVGQFHEDCGSLKGNLYSWPDRMFECLATISATDSIPFELTIQGP